MLESCAPQSTIRAAKHSYVVKYNGLIHWNLPKHKSIELGHVRKMVRHLGLDSECVRKYMPQL